MTKQVHCPHCGQTVPWTPESRWRPFCSERCRLIDLGDWLEERHCIPVVENDHSTEAETAFCCEQPAISHQHH